MQRVHVIGRKNHGKTTLVVDLVQELTQRGLRVATIKHTHHRHELDTPGKDSHRHREAGAARVGILTPQLNACFWPPEAMASDSAENKSARYAVFDAMFADCDWVIVEGDTDATEPKLEVWRRVVGSAPLANSDPSIRLVVTDDRCEVQCQVLARNDVAAVADWLLQLESGERT